MLNRLDVRIVFGISRNRSTAARRLQSEKAVSAADSLLYVTEWLLDRLRRGFVRLALE
jgi:hypothetical protein